MAFTPTADLDLDAHVATLKTKKNVYNAAVAAEATAAAALAAKVAATAVAKAELISAADVVEADAITFKTF